MRKRKKGLMIGIVSFVTIALILATGGKLYMSNEEKENIENQRTAAISFKNVQPGVEEIKFIQEGSLSGSGTWTVGGNVKVDGKQYSEIFRKEGLMGGDDLPEGNSGTKNPIKVFYSNGQEEIIK